MIHLELFQPKHVTAEYLSWLNDRDLMKYSEQRHLRHNYHTSCFYARQVDYMWAVLDGVFVVGTIAASVDRHNDVADMGIMIGIPKQGYGLRAWKIALSRLEHRKIVAGCMAGNEGMVNILEKTMTHEYTVPNQFLFEHKPMDAVYYAKNQTVPRQLQEAS